jgi:hypothetical protein
MERSKTQHEITRRSANPASAVKKRSFSPSGETLNSNNSGGGGGGFSSSGVSTTRTRSYSSRSRPRTAFVSHHELNIDRVCEKNALFSQQLLKYKPPVVHAAKARHLNGQALNVNDVPEIREALRAYQLQTAKRYSRDTAQQLCADLYSKKSSLLTNTKNNKPSFYSTLQAYFPSAAKKSNEKFQK